MKYPPNIWLIIFAGIIFTTSCSKRTNILMNKRTEVKENWVFHMEGDSQEYKANVPGCVQLDMLLNNKLPQPFYRNNETKYQWIDKENWIYITQFVIDSNAFNYSKIFLNFEGLDTYADVRLNGSNILKANNFYRTWRVEVKDLLQVGENRLELQFNSTINEGLKQEKINKDVAELNVAVTVSAYEEGDYRITIRNPETGKEFIDEVVKLQKEKNTELYTIKIENPDLWWPNGYGKPNLYTFEVVLSKGNEGIQSKEFRIGLRDIQVVRESDKQGQSFYFKVNGIPVFAKGANYIPNDNFLSRVSDEKYTHIVKSAHAANMNMLRVWGGGIYENDIFYQLCDEFGILVWQDFMYACSMYPGDDEFIKSAESEAVESIKKLRNNACLAIWCGNNEIDAAWCQWDDNCGWGWKELYNEEQKAYIWKAYDTLFHHVLPDVVNAYSPGTFYWPSSPISDWGKQASYTSNSGDMHYWGVWHGGEPFSKFDEVIPRFMSEYGFQSFPEFNTVNEFTLPEDWDIYSEIMLAHQRSPIGNQKIREYMELYYKVPTAFKELLYVGQLLQSYGISKAIDIHRINKPFCMGSLYWQLNDCWPGASWSSIDYYGNWKALHYGAKKAFRPIRIATLEKDNDLKVYVLNDDPNTKEGILQMDIVDFYGNNLYQNQQVIQFDFESSTLVNQMNLSEIPDKIDRKKSFLIIRLIINEKLADESHHYFVLPKDLELPQSAIKYEIEEKSDEIQIVLSSKCLEKDVYISIPEVSAIYSDNYFDLLPDQTRTIVVHLTRIENNVLNKGVNIQTLNNINNKY
jgi:beta-mannosidase